MEDVNNFKEFHTFYAFALGVQANDAVYFKHEINLQLSRPEIEITLTSNPIDGAVYKSTQELSFTAKWHDPYFSQTASYVVVWTCIGNNLACTRMKELYPNNETDQIGYIVPGETGDFSGNLAITLSVSKYNADGVLQYTKTKSLSFTV